MFFGLVMSCVVFVGSVVLFCEIRMELCCRLFVIGVVCIEIMILIILLI